MRGRHPHFRRDLLLVENADGVTQLDLLNLVGQAGKFTAWHPATHAGHIREVTMLIPVQTNSPTTPLPEADAVPEIVDFRRAEHELLVPIVRDHGHERLNIQVAQIALEETPNAPVHRRANVVEAQDESCSHGDS